MKENYMLMIDYRVTHFSGEVSECFGYFVNMTKFWKHIEEQYPEAISVEIEDIGIDW